MLKKIVLAGISAFFGLMVGVQYGPDIQRNLSNIRSYHALKVAALEREQQECDSYAMSVELQRGDARPVYVTTTPGINAGLTWYEEARFACEGHGTRERPGHFQHQQPAPPCNQAKIEQYWQRGSTDGRFPKELLVICGITS